MVATVLACAVALLSSVQGAVAQYGGYGGYGVPPGLELPTDGGSQFDLSGGQLTYGFGQGDYGMGYGEYGMVSVSTRRLMQDMGSYGDYGYGMASDGYGMASYGYGEPGYGGASISGTYGMAAGRRLLQDMGSSGYGSGYGTYASEEGVYGYGQPYYGMY